MSIATLMRAPVSVSTSKLDGLSCLDHPRHARRGVVLHMAHIGLHHVEPVLRHHLAELVHALGVGRGLRLQVGDVLRRVAGRVGALGEQLEHRVFAEAAALDQLERVDIDSLLLDARRLRAHRAWRNAADIGVVPARRDEEQNLGAAFGEHRRHHGDVGKMRAAIIGRVQHPHIAGREIGADLAPHRLDAAVHRAEMHRDMRRVGDEAPFAIEDGAGEVEPLLDVDRARRVLQRVAHLLGDRGEALVEHFEQHGIDAGAERGPRLALAWRA